MEVGQLWELDEEFALAVWRDMTVLPGISRYILIRLKYGDDGAVRIDIILSMAPSPHCLQFLQLNNSVRQ